MLKVSTHPRHTFRLRIPRWCSFHRVRRDESGATAVEFGLIALPFFALLFAILETSLVFFSQQILDDAAKKTGRLLMTGQVQNKLILTEGSSGEPITNREQFKQLFCKNVVAMLNCADGVMVDVKTYPPGKPFENNLELLNGDVDPTKLKFEPGAAGDIVVVRAMYVWPLATSFHNLANYGSNSRLLVSTVTFRNEPF